ncbi:MAG: hypothetical protein EAZ85_08580 [Bacteroidetes bacterium]|nr:MAG: hypothetical protein EAZ85_08580 [Bacteroidota bacterium]
MKSFLLFFQMMAIIIHIKAQQIPDSKNYTIVYYPKTSKAKISIVNKNYKEALTHYKSAFKSVKRSFSSDVYNAMVCSIMINNYDQAIVFADTLFDKGINIEKIQKKITEFPDIFSSFEQSTQWQKTKKEYPNRKQKYLRPKEKEVKDFLSYLSDLDQKPRGIKNNIPDTLIFKGKKINTKNIDRMDSLTMAEFKLFIKEKGFPSEDVIGKLDIHESNYPFNLLMIHYSYLKSFHQDFDEMLLNEVKKGNFYVENYMYLADRYMGAPNLSKTEVPYGCIGFCCYTDKDVAIMDKETREKLFKECLWRVPKSYIANQDKLDINRKKLGVNTFSEFLKTAIFSTENRYFELEISSAFMVAGKNYEVKFKDKLELLEIIKK